MNTRKKLRMIPCLALTILVWEIATSTAAGQIVVTNGCLILSYQPNQTNSVCGAPYVFTDPGVTILSNLCPDAVLPPFEIRCQPPLGTSLGLGVRSISCQVVASNGSIAAGWQFSITVKSTLAPAVLLCPTNPVIVVPCESNCAPVMYTLPEVINGTLVQCSPPPGTCFTPGVNPVACSATNQCGNYSTCFFNVRVAREAQFDMEACPPMRVLFIPCASGCVPVDYPLPAVTNGTLISCTPPPGTCFPISFNQVFCQATNDCGDTLGCAFMVRVVSEPPVILCPTNEIAVGISASACATNYCVPVAYPLPEVRGGTLIECTPPPGTCFSGNPVASSLVHRVVCRATNNCGTLTECAFSIRVFGEARGPRITCPGFRVFTNQCGSDCVPASYPLPTVGNGWLRGCSPPPGTCLPVGTRLVYCVADNACGFTDECFFELRVVQAKPPQPTIRVVRREDLYSLFWENECGSIGLLETSDEPDGPWEVITGAGPGYLVDPSRFKQFFRVTIPE